MIAAKGPKGACSPQIVGIFSLEMARASILARPEVTRNCLARPVYAKPKIIFGPGPACGL